MGQKAKQLVARCEHLLVLHPVLESRAARLALQVLRNAGEATAAQAYVELYRLLAQEVELASFTAPGDAWQRHLAEQLLMSESLLSQKSRRGDYLRLGSGATDAIKSDLGTLAALYHAGSAFLLRQLPGGCDLPPLDGFAPSGTERAAASDLLERLHDTSDWATLMDALAMHYASSGGGVFARYRAFRWLGAGLEPPLRGVRHPDPIRLDDLFGDIRQRDTIRANTEHFIAGHPANNVLLYGDRGTGKSSTVKALLHAYGDWGLRLIEVGRTQLGDFSAIIELVGALPEKFILFVDDLSFDEHETAYKDLKAVLEGGIEAHPANVLVYATSNRRHLVKERHSDRAQPGDDELHGFDTVQEKLSLADRFGITLTFVAPSQEQYLAIVRGLAAQRGITLPDGQLSQRALQWAGRHNGRSGRSARQFINALSAEAATPPL